MWIKTTSGDDGIIVMTIGLMSVRIFCIKHEAPGQCLGASHSVHLNNNKFRQL